MTGKAKKGRAELLESLERRILSGELVEGERLPPERTLAKCSGLSRPLVREVLRHLTERNLIEVLPGSGAYVMGTSSHDVERSMGLLLRRRGVTPRQLVEARGMIEAEAAALASVRATGRDLVIMRTALECFDAASDILERARFDLVFHSAVVRAAHNPVLDTMYAAMAESVIGMMIRSLGDPVVSRVGLPYHSEILKAVDSGDEEASRMAVLGHLKVAGRLYGEDYDTSVDVLAGKELRRFVDVDADLESLSRISRRGST